MVDKQINRIQQIKKEKFLSAFAEHGTVTRSAEIAGIHRLTHYDWLKNDPDYAERFEDAKGQFVERIEAEIDRRAIEGVDDIVVSGGKIVTVEDKDGNKVPLIKKKYSDNLLMFRAKKLDPSYRENHEVLHKIGLDAESIAETMREMEANGYRCPNPFADPSKMVIAGETVGNDKNKL